MLIIRDSQLQTLQAVAIQQNTDALVVEIQKDFPAAASDAGEGEILAAIRQGLDAGPRFGFVTWAGAAMLAKVIFLLGEEPWEAPGLERLSVILNDMGYPTEAAKMQAFIDAVADHIDGVNAAGMQSQTRSEA